jgi:uncharacterized protein YbcI
MGVAASRGELLAEVSKLARKVYADQVGRGPTKVRAFAEGNVIVCLMEDTLTVGEQTLIDGGEDGAVQGSRAAFRQTMEERLRAGVEALSGRRVEALLGASNLRPDIIAQVFVLDGAPNGEWPSSGAQKMP